MAPETTLLRCLAGIVAADSGEIDFDDEPFRRQRIDQRKRLFLLPDFPFVYDDMSVLRHIGMVLRLYEADRPGVEETVIDLLKEFGILHLADAKFGTLSRGETYKAVVVALLASDPELWMFDEPFASGMDPRGLNAFRRHAVDAAGRGRTILFTTQILELVEDFADEVCILDRGHIHTYESLDELRQGVLDGSQDDLAGIFERLSENQR